MTLISNVIADNFIVLAADQRRAFNIGSESGDLADDVNKLFVGNNYCMGIQGDVSNTENIYLNKLKAFMIISVNVHHLFRSKVSHPF